jgi:hypothetical protein
VGTTEKTGVDGEGFSATGKSSHFTGIDGGVRRDLKRKRREYGWVARLGG